jgi:addiction module RelB/DinJ family antitoxin
MSTIAFRIDNELKQQFTKITNNIGIDSSTALRFFINKVVKNPDIIKINLDEDLLSDVMKIGENSFSEVWDNKEDDIYSKLYKNA